MRNEAKTATKRGDKLTLGIIKPLVENPGKL